MTERPIDKIKRILREKAEPPGTPLDVQQRRESMETAAFDVKDDIQVEAFTIANCDAEWVRAPGTQDDHAILFIHGGGYVIGSPNTHRALAGEISRATQASVLLIDYRLAPEHPFPAGLEDCVAAFRELLGQGFEPANTAIVGDSAGAGLTMATLVSTRDQDMPMPGVAVCISPWSDLTISNGSYDTLAEADPMVTKEELIEMSKLYLNDADPKTPLASPNFADLSGLPPLLIHVGNDEILLDNAVALDAKAKADGVDSTLEIWDEMIHVWHAFHPMLPEAKQAIERVGEFLRHHWDQ